MKSNGIWWNSWGFKYQILWNPMEFYDDLIDSSHIQMFMVQSCLLLRVVKKTSQKVPPLPSGGGY